MTTRDEHDRSNVDAMLSGGTFRVSESMRQQLWNRLQTDTKKELRKPTRWPVFRPALAAVFVALFALVIISVAVVALSPKEKAASVVDGISAVYKAGLVQTINETQPVGNISITLDWVYADPNQILVAYSGQGSSDDAGRLEIKWVSAVLDDGTLLKGGPISGYSQPGTEASVATFAIPENERNRDVLQVQVVLRAAHTQYKEAPTPVQSGGAPESQAVTPLQIERTVAGEVTFFATIQVKPGRVIEVGKTVENKGIAVKLEQISLAPSLTVATVCIQAPDPEHYRDWIPIATLSTSGQRFSGAGSGYQVGEPYSCQQVHIQGSVPQDQGQYIFRVDELVGFKFAPGDSPTVDDHPEQQMRVTGPWIFEVK